MERRTRRSKKTVRADPVHPEVPAKRPRNDERICFLPDEILVYIFSFLSHEQLYRDVRPVCRRWYVLAATPTLWRSISADNRVPTDVLCRWLEHSPLLDRISLSDRCDLNVLADRVSKCAPRLRSLEIRNCWGHAGSDTIRAAALCKLVERCHELNSFKFSQTKIRSSKFFRLLAKEGPHCCSSPQCYCAPRSYSGPINKRQLEALEESLLLNPHYIASWIGTRKNDNVLVNQSYNGSSWWDSLVKSHVGQPIN